MNPGKIAGILCFNTLCYALKLVSFLCESLRYNHCGRRSCWFNCSLAFKKIGHNVLLIEQKKYPHHRVCGEYVSNEVLPYLEQLGISLVQTKAANITTVQISSATGRSITTQLPFGGKGISRYAFDYLLFQKAKEKGVSFLFESVNDVLFQNNDFQVTTDKNKSFTSSIVLGSYGKREVVLISN